MEGSLDYLMYPSSIFSKHVETEESLKMESVKYMLVTNHVFFSFFEDVFKKWLPQGQLIQWSHLKDLLLRNEILLTLNILFLS